jgi:uncharacterized protein YcbX
MEQRKGGGSAEEARVKALFIYPVKSCAGISVSNAFISSTGFQWDRQWVLVNERGRFITQRQEPKLALVKVSLPPEVLHDSWGPLPKNAFLSFNAPGMQQLKVPLVPSAPLEKIDHVIVWSWSGPGLLEGPDATRWFTEYLGKPARLIRLDNDSMNRATDPKYAAGFQTAFSDNFPFLMISQASLDALNERLPNPLPINRFRPNIFIEGCEPFAEDTWDTLTIGKYTFHGVKLCPRCKITTTDQSTAEVGQEPLVTLRTFRAGPHLSSLHDMRNGAFFGQNLTCDESLLPHNGTHPILRVGDAIHVEKIATVTEIMS